MNWPNHAQNPELLTTDTSRSGRYKHTGVINSQMSHCSLAPCYPLYGTQPLHLWILLGCHCHDNQSSISVRFMAVWRGACFYWVEVMQLVFLAVSSLSVSYLNVHSFFKVLPCIV